MKIRMKSMAFTQMGMFEKGQELTDEKFSKEFLIHLVEEAGAADYVEYETKIDDVYEAKKKPLSSQSLPQAKASKKKTASSRKKKPKSSQ